MINHRPLFKESIQAWDYGPVIPDIYSEFKQFGGNRIVDYFASDVEVREGTIKEVTPHVSEDDAEVMKLLERVLASYGKLSPVQLSNMTHREGEPWKILYDSFEKKMPRHADIPDDLIRGCFERILHANSSEQ